MKFIGESYSLYAKDIHQIWCRSAKFSWKSKFCSESGSGSWYYLGFQYQTYISYIEDTHQILFGSANSFESYCVHMKRPRTYIHPDRQTDRQNFFLLVLSYKTYSTNHEHLSKGENFLFVFHSCDYNTFSFYILCMWWESKKKSSIHNQVTDPFFHFIRIYWFLRICMNICNGAWRIWNFFFKLWQMNVTLWILNMF